MEMTPQLGSELSHRDEFASLFRAGSCLAAGSEGGEEQEMRQYIPAHWPNVLLCPELPQPAFSFVDI